MRTKLIFTALMPMALFLALCPAALALTTWYVNGANGKDSNNCLSAATACRTIKHAISLAVSGDSITIAPAVYSENLIINSSLKLTGSSARTTIIDGAQSRVISILSTSAHVTLTNLTIRNGLASGSGGGILNLGNLTLSNSAITGNIASGECTAIGGGIRSSGTLTVNNSTFSGNKTTAYLVCGTVYGGAIFASGPLVMNNSTVSGNSAAGGSGGGGGIYTAGGAIISNTTIAGNSGHYGGGIYNGAGTTRISNTTIAGNSGNFGGGIYNGAGTLTIQNSIVSGSSSGGNCSGGTMTSYGYNLSSDLTCNKSFHISGDLNNVNPMLGTLGNNGGPTNTMALQLGSPAIDTGNPSGCKDSQGNLLKTDQRGSPRPDKEDTGSCDRGAYEHQGSD